MRLYTARGDTGQTDLLGERVGKDDPRIAILGALDETTSAIGVGRAHAATERARSLLLDAQRDLYRIMADLAFTDELRPSERVFGADRVGWLETAIEAVGVETPLPPDFIVPGDSVAGAHLDVARTVARRAERDAVTSARARQIANPEILRYLNRLSSLLFILARAEDRAAGAALTRAKTDSGN